MTIRVAINGYGRIGRNKLRALYENGKKHDIEIVAINDLGDAKTNAHLTQYDTAHGKFPGEVSVDGDYLVVNGDNIRVLATQDGRTVLIVSHVTPIKMLIAAALLAPASALYRMHLDVAALSEIDWYADGPAVLRSFNDTGHLS